MADNSPGVYYTVTDNTDYESNPTVASGTTVVIIGFAKMGPVNEPTLITSYNQYTSTFGKPISGQYAGLALKNVLSSGGNVLFVRIADESIATKSNVVLKDSASATNGAVVYNYNQGIVVGTSGYENSEVYIGKITNASGKSTKTLVYRTPESGSFKISEILTQSKNCLQESYGWTEYKKASTIKASYRNFFIKVEGTNQDTEESISQSYGPYFVNVLASQSGTSLANVINSSITNGTTPYQKFYIDLGTTENLSEATVDMLSADEKQYFIIIEKDGTNSTPGVAITPTDGSTIKMSELAEQITDAIETYGIRCQWCYNVDSGDLPYLLFFSTTKENFDIKPYYEEDSSTGVKTICSNSLFAPYYAVGYATYSDRYYDTDTKYDDTYGYIYSDGNSTTLRDSTGTATEDDDLTASSFALKLTRIKAQTKSYYSEDDIPAEVVYNSDSKSFIFTPLENEDTNLAADGSKITVTYTKGFGKFLFDDGSTSSDTIDETAAKADNTKCIGTYRGAFAGEAASALSVKRNSDGQIEFYEDGVLEYGSVEDIDNSNYYTLEDLFGNVVKSSAVEDTSTRYIVKKAGSAGYASTVKDVIVWTAREYGEGTTNIGIKVETVTSSVDGSESHNISLYVAGNQKATWDDVSYNPNDDDYFVNVINEDSDNGGNDYVKVKVIKNDTSTEEVGMLDTTEYTTNGIVYLGTAVNSASEERDADTAETSYQLYDYQVGNNGIPTDTDELFEDALDTSGALTNKLLYSWNILITPDNISEDVQDTAIALCEYMENAMYIADPPQGLSRKNAVAWSNGSSNGGRGSAITSEFASGYWPWCKVYDSTTAKNIWVMPSVVMAARWCLTDKEYGSWYAPAGQTNGVLSSVSDIEEYPNKTDRDAMYTGTNRLNPIIKLRNGTIVAYGEKTFKRKNSTLTKIHTERMICELKHKLDSQIESFTFKPTTSDNVASVKNLVTTVMESYKTGGGISWYKVVCDSTNNTSETLQQDILNISIVCVPVGCIEQVNISLTLEKSATE